MLGPESAILDEPDNLADVAATNLCATSFENIPVAQPEPQAQTLPPLEPTTKKKKRVKTEKDFARDRARQANVGRNIQMAKILDEHGIDSPQGVRDFFSEEATVKGQLEAQVRSLTKNLAAEKERADNLEKELLEEQSKRAKTAASTVTREMEQERKGYLEEIANRDADIRELKDTATAVQMSNVDKEGTYKKELGTAARKLKQQEKIAEAATKAKNTADELAANLAKELKVKQFIVDSITELEANWEQEKISNEQGQLAVEEDRARMARVNSKLRLNLKALRAKNHKLKSEYEKKVQSHSNSHEEELDDQGDLLDELLVPVDPRLVGVSGVEFTMPFYNCMQQCISLAGATPELVMKVGSFFVGWLEKECPALVMVDNWQERAMSAGGLKALRYDNAVNVRMRAGVVIAKSTEIVAIHVDETEDDLMSVLNQTMTVHDEQGRIRDITFDNATFLECKTAEHSVVATIKNFELTKTAHEELCQEYQKGLDQGTLALQFMFVSSTDSVDETQTHVSYFCCCCVHFFM